VKAKFLFGAGSNAPGKAICYHFNALGQADQLTERYGADANTNACDGYAVLVGLPTDNRARSGIVYLLSRVKPETWYVLLVCVLIGLVTGLIPREKRRQLVMAFTEARRFWDVPFKTARRVRLPSLGWKTVSYALVVVMLLADDRWGIVLNARADCTYPANTSTETTRVTQFAYDYDGHLTQVNSPEGVINYGVSVR